MVPDIKFNSEKEREFHIKDMQSLASICIDKLDSSNKKALRKSRRDSAVLGESPPNKTDYKYGFVNQRKIALFSYIANYPELVDDTRLGKLVNVWITRYDRESADVDGNVQIGSNVIALKDKGKFGIIPSVIQQTLIHEMIHTTSFQNDAANEIINLADEEISKYTLLEEGIAEAKTQKILQSVEYREMCKKYGEEHLNVPVYYRERVIVNSLDLLADGKLFLAHGEDKVTFDNVLENALCNSAELKQALYTYAQYTFGKERSPEKALSGYQQFCNEAMVLLNKKDVTEQNVLQFASLADCISYPAPLGVIMSEESMCKYEENINNFSEAMYTKVAMFDFDTTKLDEANAKFGEKPNKTTEETYEYLDWLDSTGLTKIDTYAKFVYMTNSNRLRMDKNLKIYYNEAKYNQPKGSMTEGDIWTKARKVAEFREDNETLGLINGIIAYRPGVQESITPKKSPVEQDLYDGENVDLSLLEK